MEAQLAEKLRAHLQGLRRELRYAVLMYYGDDLTAQEISMVLGTPVFVVEEALRAFRADMTRIMATSAV